MGVYYISACHDCKERVMWLKCPKETAENWHEEFHKGHEAELGIDEDDEFYDRIWEYKDLGVQSK